MINKHFFSTENFSDIIRPLYISLWIRGNSAHLRYVAVGLANTIRRHSVLTAAAWGTWPCLHGERKCNLIRRGSAVWQTSLWHFILSEKLSNIEKKKKTELGMRTRTLSNMHYINRCQCMCLYMFCLPWCNPCCNANLPNHQYCCIAAKDGPIGPFTKVLCTVLYKGLSHPSCLNILLPKSQAFFYF